MILFDSHCHLHFSQFDRDREEIIKKLRDFDMKAITVGTDLEDSKKAIDLASKYHGQLWATVGCHPSEAGTVEDFGELKILAENENVVAIGECGLEYFHEKNKNKQKEIFLKQIELAEKLNKPLIIHCRSTAGTEDAYEDALEILKYKNINIPDGNGVIHFFSGSKKIAREFLDLGFYISFAGPITFPVKTGVSQYEELVKYIPLDKILIETDSPFAAPVPHRGKRNEPVFVEFVARQIAEWKNLSFEKVANQAAINAIKLFALKRFFN
jgi:TatD DNase family protein